MHQHHLRQNTHKFHVTGLRAVSLLQVYYVPRRPIYAQSTAPTFVGVLRLLRVILVREAITLVHAHQAFSSLGIEALLHARTMGYKVREWETGMQVDAAGGRLPQQ